MCLKCDLDRERLRVTALEGGSGQISTTLRAHSPEPVWVAWKGAGGLGCFVGCLVCRISCPQREVMALDTRGASFRSFPQPEPRTGPLPDLAGPGGPLPVGKPGPSPQGILPLGAGMVSMPTPFTLVPMLGGRGQRLILPGASPGALCTRVTQLGLRTEQGDEWGGDGKRCFLAEPVPATPAFDGPQQMSSSRS